MATTVENQICETCGADIRSGALFCYSCGNSVQPPAAPNNKKNVSETQFQEKLAEKNGNKSQQKSQAQSKERVETPIPDANIQAEPKLKSAAAMRRKSKIYHPKKIEIIWEENENRANGWFIVTAIILTLLAVGVFYLAIYLKY